MIVLNSELRITTTVAAQLVYLLENKNNVCNIIIMNSFDFFLIVVIAFVVDVKWLVKVMVSCSVTVRTSSYFLSLSSAIRRAWPSSPSSALIRSSSMLVLFSNALRMLCTCHAKRRQSIDSTSPHTRGHLGGTGGSQRFRRGGELSRRITSLRI